jgi:hypothetical protein
VTPGEDSLLVTPLPNQSSRVSAIKSVQKRWNCRRTSYMSSFSLEVRPIAFSAYVDVILPLTMFCLRTCRFDEHVVGGIFLRWIWGFVVEVLTIHSLRGEFPSLEDDELIL